MATYKETSPEKMYESMSNFVSTALGYDESSGFNLVVKEEREPKNGSFITFKGKVKEFKIREEKKVTRESIERSGSFFMTISRQNELIAVGLEKYKLNLFIEQPFEIRVSQPVSLDTVFVLRGLLEKEKIHTFSGKIKDINFPWPYQYDSTSLQPGCEFITGSLAWLIEDSPTFKKLIIESTTKPSKAFLLKTEEVEIIWNEFLSTYKPEQRKRAEEIHQNKKSLLNFLSAKKGPIEVTIDIHKIDGHIVE